MNSIQAIQAALETIKLTEHDFYVICVHPNDHRIDLQGKLTPDRLKALENAGFDRVNRDGGKYINHVGKIETPTEDDTPLWRVEVILT